MAILSDVLVQARTFLNDDNITQTENAVLIPKVQEAHRELQTLLWNNGSPIVRGEIIIQIPANTSELNGPGDLINPTEIWENNANAPISDVNWSPVTESFSIPFGLAPGNRIDYWAWREEKISLLQCATNRSIYLKYRKKLTIPSDPGDEIGVIFGELYLSARSAGIFAGTLGNVEVYDKLTELAKMNFAEVLKANRGSA